MNLFEIFGNSFLVGLSGAMMPGPLLVVALARTPSRGPSTGPLVTVGHGIVELFTVAILAFGLAAIVKQEPMIARVIAVVGGAALLLMSLSMLAEIRRGIKAPAAVQNIATAPRVGGIRLIREGAVATISNPYWFVWWATIGSALVITSLKSGAIGAPVFYVGHILSDLVWYSAVTIVVWQGKNLFAGRRYHYMLAGCALFLIWLGGWFIYSGVTGAIEL